MAQAHLVTRTMTETKGAPQPTWIYEDDIAAGDEQKYHDWPSFKLGGRTVRVEPSWANYTQSKYNRRWYAFWSIFWGVIFCVTASATFIKTVNDGEIFWNGLLVSIGLGVVCCAGAKLASDAHAKFRSIFK